MVIYGQVGFELIISQSDANALNHSAIKAQTRLDRDLCIRQSSKVMHRETFIILCQIVVSGFSALEWVSATVQSNTRTVFI